MTNVARPPALAWPTGGLQWKPEWQALLPVVRGIHAPPVPDRDVLLAGPVLLDEAEKHSVEARQRVSAQALRAVDPEAWLALHADGKGVQIDWLLAACAALRGPAVALEIAFALAGKRNMLHPHWIHLLFGAVRDAVACADDAAHDAALAVAERERRRTAFAERACAFVFAHRADWVAAWLANADDGWNFLMHGCVMPPQAFLACAASQKSLGPEKLLPGVLLQCRLHGEGALEGLALLLDRALASRDVKNATLACKLAAAFHAPGILDLLADRAEHKKVRDAFDKLADSYPVAALLVGIRRMLCSRARAAETFALRLAVQQPDALPAALAELDTAGRARFETTRAALAPAEAPPDALPALLREPPWLRADRPGELPVLQVAAIPTPEAVAWPPGLREAALQADFSHRPFSLGRFDANGFAAELNLGDEAGRRLLAGQPLRPEDCRAPLGDYGLAECLALAPAAAQVALWNSYPADRLSYAFWRDDNPQHAMLARHGVAVFPGLLDFLGGALGKAPRLALLLDTPALVDRMARLLHMPNHGAHAAAWILKFPRTVLCHALPGAFAAEPTRGRDDARRVVRWLAEQGHRPLVLDVAAAYGGGMPAAAQALVDTDPLFVLPSVMPRLPAFFDPAACRRPLLANGAGALPVAVLPHVALMLAISPPDLPYPGLAQLKNACTPASLAEFAWDLYESWAGAGGPAKDNWAWRALALLGDDETARRLLPRINEWSADATWRARAEAGVALLAQMGSDLALMALNVLATKARHKRVQRKAADLIAGVAQARGLSAEELADRLVPTLGLDEPDAAVLDFGPRRFTIAFDEALKPFVRDPQGARLKDLPKPLKSDDAVLATAASERYKALKKDAKTIASLQVTRLERAMLLRRRWTAAEFRQLFLQHPLMRHLATRLAWGLYDGERCMRALRMAEDWTLADSADALLALDDGAVLGIPHVLELPADECRAMSQLFVDYEVLQPFPQLAREIFGVTPEECALDCLARWAGKDVAVGSLLGLAQWNWQRGRAGNHGMIESYRRPANEGLEVAFDFSPGIFAGGGQPAYRQTLGQVRIIRAEGPSDPPPRFADLDAVHASELIRDLESLTPARDDIP
jgi:hypothetical protein